MNEEMAVIEIVILKSYMPQEELAFLLHNRNNPAFRHSCNTLIASEHDVGQWERLRGSQIESWFSLIQMKIKV